MQLFLLMALSVFWFFCNSLAFIPACTAYRAFSHCLLSSTSPALFTGAATSLAAYMQIFHHNHKLYFSKKLLYPICILHSSFIEEIKSNVTTYFSLLAFICKEGLFRYSTISHPFLIKYLSNSYKVSSDVYSVVIGKILARKDFAIIALLFANATSLTK